MPTGSAPRKRLTADARRAQLLDVAADLFADRGYARATTAEIARAAGVTEPVIYRHFQSKRDLFVALVEQTAEQTLDLWRRSLEAADDPGERLQILLGANPMVALGDDEAVRYRIILQAITETSDEMIHRAVVDHFRSVHAFVESEVTAAQQARKVSGRVPAGMIAWILIDVALGFGVLEAMGITGHHRAGDADVVQVIAQILLPRRA
ncbi:MAG: helix-turn-helix domain-containing protein [Planctomycetota bacterium]